MLVRRLLPLLLTMCLVGCAASQPKAPEEEAPPEVTVTQPGVPEGATFVARVEGLKTGVLDVKNDIAILAGATSEEESPRWTAYRIARGEPPLAVTTGPGEAEGVALSPEATRALVHFFTDEPVPDDPVAMSRRWRVRVLPSFDVGGEPEPDLVGERSAAGPLTYPWSPDGRVWLSAPATSGRGMRMWGRPRLHRADTMVPLPPLPNDAGPVMEAWFSPDGDAVYAFTNVSETIPDKPLYLGSDVCYRLSLSGDGAEEVARLPEQVPWTPHPFLPEVAPMGDAAFALRGSDLYRVDLRTGEMEHRSTEQVPSVLDLERVCGLQALSDDELLLLQGLASEESARGSRVGTYRLIKLRFSDMSCSVLVETDGPRPSFRASDGLVWLALAPFDEEKTEVVVATVPLAAGD